MGKAIGREEQMRQRTIAFCGALAIAFTVSAQALQETVKPSFAGQWIERDGELLTVAQKSENLTLTSKLGERTQVTTYRLDGKPSKNSIVTIAGDVLMVESQVRWVGNSLLIISKTTRGPGASWEWIRIFSFEAALDDSDAILNEVVIDHSHEGGPGMVTRLKSFRRKTD